MKMLKKRILLIMMSFLLIFSGNTSIMVSAASPIKLVVDGKDITSLSSPIIENDRTLVPIRFISEELGATVTWDGVNRTVVVEKGDRTVFLRIGSQLIDYNNGTDYDISDVAPKIYNDRTFVPLRLISNALGIGIEWVDETRTVIVDSSKSSEVTSFFDIQILSPNLGQAVSGTTNLQLGTSSDYLKDGNQVRFLLLDRDTAKGFVVAKGDAINGSYNFMTKIEDNGKKVLVGGVYDNNGKFLGGDAIPLDINVNPQVSLSGLSDGQTITNSATFGTNLNFFAKYVKYEITNLDTGNVTTTEVQDPLGTYTWAPSISQNGNYSIRTIAYDGSDNGYSSSPVNIEVDVIRKLSLNGVTAGSTIKNEVNLIANRNFDVSSTEYIIRDVNTGIVSTLAKIPYGGYKWSPGPSDSGEKELFVRVISGGVVYDSDPIRVTVDGSPKLFLEGIGPKQVVTEPVSLKATSNVPINNIKYVLLNSRTGVRRTISSGLSLPAETTYTPISSDAGEMVIQVEGTYEGQKISSELIVFKVFLGETYGPKPVVAKDQFINMASKLAKESYEKTGMSAALQTAQSILETGWGQSVPVDKYTGVLSNNLFGIKGIGPAGSVTSNTWEVYNGVTFRIDADFRAYNNVADSWADHKEFLNKDRYTNFRSVMFDYSQGAWALKRAGYATDPQYPIKLMNLIKQYNLDDLDKVGI